MKKFNSFIIDEFLIEKFVNEWLSPKSLECYFSFFKILLETNHLNVEDFNSYTSSAFKRFLGENLIEKNWSSWTYNSYRKYARVFCEYLVREEYIEENPIDKIKKRKEEKKLPKALSKEQVNELKVASLTAFDLNTFVWKRNNTFLHTFLYTWIRKSELLNLKIWDINLEEGYIKVVKGKWWKDRIVPIISSLERTLLSFMQARISISSKEWYLFCSIRWNKLQDRDMRVIIDKLRKCTTFHFTWHSLRHTFATELVRNNFDIYNISQLLWHTKIETTKIYLSVDTHKIKNQLEEISMF